MNRKRIALTAAGLGLVAVVALSGCGTHTSAPDPTGANTHAGNRQAVIQEPYGFRNVAFSCNGPDGIYVTSAGASDTLPSGVSVVVNDPACK